MKYYMIGAGVIVVVLIFMLMISTETLNILADLSSIFFFMFALMNIIIIATVIGVEMANNLKLQMVQQELDALEKEKYYIEYNNDFNIDFNHEAVQLCDALKAVQEKINIFQESGYENL